MARSASERMGVPLATTRVVALGSEGRRAKDFASLDWELKWIYWGGSSATCCVGSAPVPPPTTLSSPAGAVPSSSGTRIGMFGETSFSRDEELASAEVLQAMEILKGEESYKFWRLECLDAWNGQFGRNVSLINPEGTSGQFKRTKLVKPVGGWKEIVAIESGRWRTNSIRYKVVNTVRPYSGEESYLSVVEVAAVYKTLTVRLIPLGTFFFSQPRLISFHN